MKLVVILPLITAQMSTFYSGIQMDFVNWTPVIVPVGYASPYKLCYGDGVWIAPWKNGYYLRSTDAYEWLLYEIPAGATGSTPAAYGNGLWIMMIGTTKIAHSTDGGINFVPSSMNPQTQEFMT